MMQFEVEEETSTWCQSWLHNVDYEILRRFGAGGASPSRQPPLRLQETCDATAGTKHGFVDDLKRALRYV